MTAQRITKALKTILVVGGGVFLVLAVCNGFRVENRLLQGNLPEPAAWNADGFERTLKALNDEFQRHWKEQGLQPAPEAPPLLLARRLSLGLAGTVPSLEEIRALERQPPERRLDWWLDRLLADTRVTDYLAERFARTWVGVENGPFLVYRRRRLVLWLSERLRQNEPYDALVRELLTAEGLWTNRPAVNFVTVTVQDGQPDAVRLAGRTARAFLAVRIDCLQCHDDHLGTIHLGDPLGLREGTQKDFHHLAAFFSGLRISGLGVHDRVVPYRVQLLDDKAERFLDPAPPFLADRLPSEGKARERLARWVTDPQNRPFARAIVNRVWGLLFGRPLVEPVDDIPLAGPFPPGLELLADDFVAHGYDLHRLIRLIAQSAAFHRDSRAEFPLDEEHERQWATFPMTRLRPEQVAGALLQACLITTLDDHAHIFARLAFYTQTNQFVRRYGDRGEEEFRDPGGTIPQRLLLMNGELVRERSGSRNWSNAAARISRLASDEQRAVEAAYLAVLTRRPSPSEAAHFVQLLRERGKQHWASVLEDVYWVLVNSTEFSWNH